MTDYMLPNPFEFDLNGKKVSIPVVNHYDEVNVSEGPVTVSGVTAGYVAALTSDASKGVAEITPGTHLMGLLRMKGVYHGTTFVPDGHEPGDDINESATFKYVLDIEDLFGAGGTWGTDTGKFLGL